MSRGRESPIIPGLKILSFNWWQGERNLVTQNAVSKPADLAGVRMRTPGAPVWMEVLPDASTTECDQVSSSSPSSMNRSAFLAATL